MSMRPGDVRMAGAIDLSALKRPAAPPPSAAGFGAASGDAPAGAAGEGSGGWVINVTEATFEAEVVVRSTQVPVVIDFWAEWCGPCKQLSPVLERLVAEYAGRWILAKVDVDAEQRIAQAFQIQSIPSVLAVLAGQPVPLFQGAVPEAQLRQVLDEVLRVAAANGVTGVAPPLGGGAGADDDLDAAGPVVPAMDPDLATAYDAMQTGDAGAAAAAFRAVLERIPGDAEARTGLARCELLLRVEGVDAADVRRRAAADPADLDAVMAAADVDVVEDRVGDAVDRLVAAIRATSGAERDAVRAHLLALFDVLDPEDPRLAAGRRSLANALF